MFIFAMIVGYHTCSPGAIVEPHETIAVYLDKLKPTLVSCKEPHEFTGAYSLVYTRPEGLKEDDPDNIALERGDPAIVAKYITPAARLDPTKTVRDYFGDRVAPETASVALTWSPEALAFMKQERQRATRETVTRAIEQQRWKDEMEIEHLLVSMQIAEDEERTAAARTSPWHWLTSQLPRLTARCEESEEREDACGVAKKTD